MFGPNHMWAKRALGVQGPKAQQTPSYVKFMNKSKYCITLIGQAEVPKCTLQITYILTMKTSLITMIAEAIRKQ